MAVLLIERYPSPGRANKIHRAFKLFNIDVQVFTANTARLALNSVIDISHFPTRRFNPSLEFEEITARDLEETRGVFVGMWVRKDESSEIENTVEIGLIKSLNEAGFGRGGKPLIAIGDIAETQELVKAGCSYATDWELRNIVFVLQCLKNKKMARQAMLRAG